jgi:bifunctional non-homologous end joining protein LigD
VTGGKGVHIHVPLKSGYAWSEVSEMALSLAKELIAKQPKLFTITPVKKEREKKIFIDYLRNNASATAVIPYSLRAKEVSSVALPLSWKELEELKSANSFDLQKALKIIEKRKRDPWEDFFHSAQKVTI